MTTNAAIVARGLTKAFGDVHALNGLDLTVPEATAVALLAPTAPARPLPSAS
jgi:ABC-type multidrug transport system ATPase subunit